MERPAFTRSAQGLRAAFVVLFCAAAVVCVVHTIRWPLMWDSTVIHYGNFLISQGKMPYRDFVEPDLPGAYIVESWATHVFGGGDLGWHVYDLFLLGLVTAACVSIARPYDPIAGLVAGISFALIHLREGPRNAAQREEVVAACLLLALALLFRANRARRPWLMLPLGFLLGLGASLKPTCCLFAWIMLIMLVVGLRKQDVPVARYVGAACAGFLIAALPSVLFLGRYHAFSAFLFNERLLLPYYVQVAATPLSGLFHTIPRQVPPALTLGLLLAFLQRKANTVENWERAVLLLGVGYGLFSYLVQRKAFEHHLYTLEAFLFLFVSLEAFQSLRVPGVVRVAGLVALTFLGLLTAWQTYALQRLQEADTVTPVLMADLTRLGGDSLNGKIQCLDLVLACPSALYRLKLVESEAFLVDFMLFPPRNLGPLPYYRQLLWNDLHTHPPQVVIVTNQWLGMTLSFDNLSSWPQFASYLDSEYSLQATRTFGQVAYRIYVRKGPPTPDASGTASLLPSLHP